MSSKIDGVPRELLERATDNKYIDKERISIYRHEALCSIRALLAAPVVERKPVALSVPDECPHLIVFDDNDRENMLFAGAGARSAALKTWEKISASWNAHLFVRIERNCRDDRYPSAHTAPPELAELQATIVHLTSEIEGYKNTVSYLDAEASKWARLHAELQTEIERLKGGQGEPVAWPDYNYQGMGCGLEDRGITDRYEACRYGFDSAIDKCAELGELYASQLSQASVALPGKMGERSDFPSAYRRYAKGWNACLDKVKELNQ